MTERQEVYETLDGDQRRKPRGVGHGRAVVAGAQHDGTLAAAARDFWAERLALDAVIVNRGINAGRSPQAPIRVIESVIVPIHLRLLLTGEPVDRESPSGSVHTVIDGIAPRP